jgi:glycosyltransferase involved in cell wall biosynthesis
VFVAPSVEEPFGQVYLEAMACGMPVIATTTGGPPSFVNTDPDRLNGWLVAPDDVDALARAMIEASADMPVRTERGRNARRTVVDGFDWLRIAERVNGIYREILT